MSNSVSIIILTYNSTNFLDSCLESIFSLDFEDFELIIVDNASSDDTQKQLSKIIPPDNINLKIILNSKNLGYGLGNKVGIDNSKGDFIAIINPDVVLEKSWLKNIIKIIKQDSKIFSVHGKILDSQNNVSSLGGILDIYGAVTQKTSSNSTPFFYTPGTAFLFRRNIYSLLEIDPNFFMYYDDVDLSWQAIMYGYKVRYCEDALSVHLEGNTFSQITLTKFYCISKNRIYMCMKNYSLNRIIKRIFQIHLLIFLDSVYYSIKHKSSKYLIIGIKAWFWNLKHFKELIKQRKKIHAKRILSDKEIESYMLKESIEFKLIRKFKLNKVK